MPQIVLVEPEIPPNTGNIARTCAATQTPLHLVEPLGFQINDRQLKRAGLDYWPHVPLEQHPSWPAFLKSRKSNQGRLLGFSRHAKKSYLEVEFHSNDWLIFGCETRGLSPEVQADCDDLLLIPMTCEAVRSLNLSVAAAVVLFEARRQLIAG
jgi:tRNA (cytidine/uridine-2'-O-)-methyltransferase